MHFCSPSTWYTWAKKQRQGLTARLGLTVDESYAINLSSFPISARMQQMQPGLMALQFATEWSWWKAGRPYYNVWPGIADALMDFPAERLSLESLMGAPESAIALQFKSPSHRGVRSIVACLMTTDRFKSLLDEASSRQEAYAKLHGGQTFPRSKFDDPDGVVLATIEENGTIAVNPLDGARSFSTEVRSFSATWDVISRPIAPENGLSDAQRAAVAVLIMERDPDIFMPDVLQNDEATYATASEAIREELVDHAVKKRGQRGWHVGRAMETVPHFRRPHPAVQHYGPRNSLVKVIMRSGCIVKRHKLTEAPTGFHGSFGEADHDLAETSHNS